MTVENDVKLNSVSVEKTRKYTELVHGAWQEALQLRQSLKVSFYEVNGRTKFNKFKRD